MTLPKGPAGITSLNGWGSKDSSQNKAGADISASMDKNPNDPGWGGGGGDGPPSIKNPPKGPTAEEIAAAKAKAEAEKRRLEAEARKKHVKDFKDTQKKKSSWTDNLENWVTEHPIETAASSLVPLGALKTKEYLDDVNKINKWSKIGYGKGNPVPMKMIETLKGSWVPNKTFEKLGHGAGSTKDWFFSRTSPKHFGPVEAVVKGLKSPVVKGITKAAPVIGTAYTVGDLLAQRSDAMVTEADRISTLEGDEQTQAIENYATKMYKPYVTGGVARKKYSTGTNGILDIDEESEDISLTAFNPKFDDVPELTEEKEEEKINLFSETEEGDPLNELLLAEDGVTTLFRAKNGGYAVQGGVKNYLGEQKMVHAPKYWQSAPDHPETELTYITKPEKDLLVKADLHGSLHGSVNKGPQGLTSLNGWGDAGDFDNDKGEISSDSGWSPGVSSPGTTSSGGNVNTGGDQEDDVAQMMHDMSITPDHSPDWTGSDQGWVVSEDEETEIGGSDYVSPKDKVRIHNEILNRKTTWDNNKWKRDAWTLISLPKTPWGIIPFAINQNKKKKERIAEIDYELELLDKIGATKFTPHTDTLYQKLTQEKLDLTQPRSQKDEDTGDGPEVVPVAPVMEEIKDYTEMAWDPMSYLDKIRAGQAQRAALQAKGIIQDNEIMTLNSGGLANLFTVKNYN